MKKIMLFLGLIMLSVASSAKSMVEIWNSMPDYVIHYIDRNNRLEMTEFIAMGLHGDVDNSFQSKSVMDTITANYIHITLSESSEMQLCRLPYAGGDSIICMVRTWKAPAAESEVCFFRQDWTPLHIPAAFARKELRGLATDLTVRPDAMAQVRYEELRAKIDPVMVSAALMEDTDELEVKLALPLLPKEDRKAVEPVMKTIRLKWNGNTFE